MTVVVHQQLENQRILAIEPDNFPQFDFESAVIENPVIFRMDGVAQLSRIALFEFLISFRKIDQGKQSCRSHIGGAGRE
ncbi:hypothetical protein HF882_00175 [Victivallis vadensis]|uniref:Uncharacterized protein n=1 Tax=Victivallis vadensis TaxID=172901 RepID=A0A848APQ9_9BACT|nr:hypothetical protein [Victivallis vadensis]NMD84991.1 hypothetical protein [Victivallis vadensis]